MKISVNNKPDGPVYRPSTKPISLPEGKGQLSIPKVIGTFPATDGDTGEQAQDVRSGLPPLDFHHNAPFHYEKVYQVSTFITSDIVCFMNKAHKSVDFIFPT